MKLAQEHRSGAPSDRIPAPQCAKARPRARRWPSLQRIAFAGLLAAALFSAHVALAQHHVPRDTSELVNEAESIAVATLVSAQSRWNSRGNLIVTDYRFRIESTPLNGGLGTHEFVVTQGGGTLDGETHSLSSNPRLVRGERYVVFLRPGRGEVFSPFVGGDQGIYRIDASGVARSLAGTDSLPLSSLLASIDPLLQSRAGQPPAAFRLPAPSALTYPSKRYEPGRFIAAPLLQTSGFVPLEADQPVGPDYREALTDGGDDQAAVSPKSAPAPNWHIGNRANRPIVWDEWPHDWWMGPIDQNMMAYWNSYADNLNRVSGAELTTWRWGNGRFEMVGFPDNASMTAQFGEAWAPGNLAVCYQRGNGSGVMIEADIALNPAITWTLDDAASTDPTTTSWNMRRSTVHELGHGWGLDHPWEFENVWWDSVLNYAPKEWRLPILHEDDTNAVRTQYPGTTITNDGLISLYQTSDTANSLQATYTAAFPNSVTRYHGDSLAFGTIQIENPGLTTISSPQVGIYLNQNWRAWTDSYLLLRTASFSSTIAPSATLAHTMSATTIPASVPTGIYYPTLWLPITGDQNTYNNFGSADPTRTVTVYNNAATLMPTTAWSTWSTGRVGPLGRWDLYLPVVAGRSYELSLCPALGNGNATFDTILAVVGYVTSDDYCGVASRVVFNSAATGTRTVRISGYNIAAQGSFTLAYRQLVTDRIFAHGFDSTP